MPAACTQGKSRGTPAAMAALPDPVCGDCIFFLPEGRGPGGERMGPCRMRPELGRISESLAYCASFKVRTARAGLVRLPEPGKTPAGAPRGYQQDLHPAAYSPGSPPIRRAAAAPPAPATPARAPDNTPIDWNTMTRDDLKQIFREALAEDTLYGQPEIGPRWRGGTLVIKPADPALQAKEVPLETFFHKIIAVRERLRVLEQRINAHPKLDDADRLELDQYISKAYGSLTTFNILFKNKEDQFSSGEG